MALNIKNQMVEKLLDEVVSLTGESKTEAVRKALEERRQRLAYQRNLRNKNQYLLSFLEDEIWSNIPKTLLGKSISKEEEDILLGYGDDGV
ncbi:MAG: type II toxin-antitoxin system VapB family antitoxin [Chloroflexota bacterium]